MEIHFLSTAVLKEHQLSARRIRLSLHKRWVSHVDTRMLKGRMALPTPTVGIHLNYMMDKGAKSWSVLGQLKGCLSTEHIPHPLTYSGFKAVIKHSRQQLPVKDSIIREGHAEQVLKKFQENNRSCLPISSVSVQFNHKMLDESRGRCTDQDFDCVCCKPNSKCSHDTTKAKQIPEVGRSHYQISCYLKLQFEVIIGHTTMRMVQLRSGFYPVSSFSPKDVITAFISILHPYNSCFLSSSFRIGMPESKIEILSLMSELIAYFSSQESFECDSILKHMTESALEPGPSLAPSLRILLRLKHDHLSALRELVLLPLVALLQSSVHRGHQKVRQMSESIETMGQYLSALEDPETDLETLKRLIGTRITDYYSPYRGWWNSLWSELPTEVCARLYLKLTTAYPKGWAEMTVPDQNCPMRDWGAWSSSIYSMSQWIEYMRGFHFENHSANQQEQDQVYLGSTAPCDNPRRFVATYRTCPTGGKLASASFFHKNHLVEQGTYNRIPPTDILDLYPIDSHSELSTHRLLKEITIYSITASMSTLDWGMMPLRSTTLQTVAEMNSSKPNGIVMYPFRIASILGLAGFDCGSKFMVIMLHAHCDSLGLLSMRLDGPQTKRYTPLDKIIAEPGLSRANTCQSIHWSRIQDPTRVFPLAFFERQQLVLFAQLSFDSIAKGQVRLGVNLYAFAHKADDQSFTLLRYDNIASHTIHHEDLQPLTNLFGWDTYRGAGSQFWFRWRQMHRTKVGLWIGECGNYSVFAWTNRRFVRLARRPIQTVKWDSSTTLMECVMGPEQPIIGLSRVTGVVGRQLGLECWLFRLRL